MGILERLGIDVKYQTWQARKDTLDVNNTHYEKNDIQDAMRVLAKNRIYISNAIDSYCQIINKDIKNPNDDLWQEVLAQHLIFPFIEDNQSLYKNFKYPKIKRVFKGLFNVFFDEVQSVLNKAVCYPQKLKRLGPPILNTSLTPGWITIIREFGTFGVLTRANFEIKQKIATDVNIPSSSQINYIVSRRLLPGIFQKNTIYCPAANQVRNHFALCAALNIGLIRGGIYSAENRIALLDGETNHFRKPEAMCEEYDLKICQPS